jgi:hypothetical protein
MNATTDQKNVFCDNYRSALLLLDLIKTLIPNKIAHLVISIVEGIINEAAITLCDPE